MPLDESKHAGSFERLVTWSSALSIGIMTALLASIRQINPSVQFRFSALTVISFLLSGAATVWFFRTVLRHHSRRRRFALLAIAAAGSVLVYLVVALKSVAPDRRGDVLFGTALAGGAVSFIAWLAWRIVRFLESEEPPKED